MVEIDGRSLRVEEVARVMSGERVTWSAESRRRVEAGWRMVERILESGRPVYGISTGVGRLCTVAVSREDVRALQRNILRSHAAGVGAALPEEVVRAMMVLRANALASGRSGVRPIVIETLVSMLNERVHPVVPEQGTVGASGDLAPLAHLALVLMGEGEAFYRGERLPGGVAMSRAGIPTVELEAKEGIALINGTQFMCALAVKFLLAAERLVSVADVVGALTMEALRASVAGLHPLVQEARPHEGQKETAGRVLRALRGSTRVAWGEYARVQDAYSIRCIPQVHGAVREVLKLLRKILAVELNSATDNPLIFPEEEVVLSGGNFHGEPLAIALDSAGIAVAAVGGMSERRIERLVNPQLSGLPAFLVRNGGLQSGYMVAQYTAAALVSENKVLAHPASVDSIPTSANQEDFVSMGGHAARKALKILENVEQVVAIELVLGCQAVDLDPEGVLGEGTRVAYRSLRETVPTLEEDRVVAEDLRAAVECVRAARFLEPVEVSWVKG